MKPIPSDYRLPETTVESVLPRPASAKNLFLLALAASTVIPMLFFFWIAGREPVGYSVDTVKGIFLFFGTAHVPATLFFYADPDYQSIIRRNRARYIYVPLLITVATGVFVVLASQVMLAYLFLFFWTWQAYHYGRQNVGVYAFASLAQKSEPPSRLEKLTIELGMVCGILGTFKLLGEGVAPSHLQGLLQILFEAGRYGFFVTFVFALIIYVLHFRRTTITKSFFFFTLTFFFLPIYLANDINITFLSYAIAHGMQYLVFTSVASGSLRRNLSTDRRQYWNAVKLAAFVLVGGMIFFFGGNVGNLQLYAETAALATAVDFLVGAVLGATMAHFIVDAHAWRLSKTSQRQYMSRRFDFVLGERR